MPKSRHTDEGECVEQPERPLVAYSQNGELQPVFVQVRRDIYEKLIQTQNSFEDLQRRNRELEKLAKTQNASIEELLRKNQELVVEIVARARSM